MMTLRDYFAAAALARLPWSRELSPADLAKNAFDVADAMMKASIERYDYSGELVRVEISGRIGADVLEHPERGQRNKGEW